MSASTHGQTSSAESSSRPQAAWCCTLGQGFCACAEGGLLGRWMWVRTCRTSLIRQSQSMWWFWIRANFYAKPCAGIPPASACGCLSVLRKLGRSTPFRSHPTNRPEYMLLTAKTVKTTWHCCVVTHFKQWFLSQTCRVDSLRSQVDHRISLYLCRGQLECGGLPNIFQWENDHACGV